MFCSIKFSAIIGKYLTGFLGFEEYFAQISGGVIIFIIIIVISSIVKRLVHPSDKVTNLFNHIAGGIGGVFQAIVFLSAILIIFNTFGFPSKNAQENSLTYSTVKNIIPSIAEYILEYTPEKEKFKEILGIDSLGNK